MWGQQLFQRSVPGPSFFKGWLLKRQPLSVPWTEPYKLHLLQARGRTSHEVCRFLPENTGHMLGWNTFYLATCSRGRTRAQLSFQQEGEVGMWADGVGRSWEW